VNKNFRIDFALSRNFIRNIFMIYILFLGMKEGKERKKMKGGKKED